MTLKYNALGIIIILITFISTEHYGTPTHNGYTEIKK